MKYLLDISYDGSKYYGFQRLNDHPTIQKELEEILSKIAKETICIKGAGRTDRGVHAYHQYCHFDTKLNIDPYKLRKYINDQLSSYIFINNCSLVDDNFHARFDAQKKTYKYRINIGQYDPIQNDYVYNHNYPLDITRMKIFSKLLVGEHSYKYFVSAKRDNYDSAIYEIIIEKNYDILEITFVGKNFYTYMVRNLVGFLIAVGKGKYLEEDVDKIFNGTYQEINYVCVPANGLYLFSINYKENP